MVALYEMEERTGELLDRLGALGIDTAEATIVRVELNQAVTVATEMRSGRMSSPPASVSPIARHTVTGAIIGSSILLVIGIALYSAGLLSLGIVEGMFAHALVSAIVGALAGAAIGFISSYLASRSRSSNRAVPEWAQLNRDGFLVAIKMPPGLAEQAEEIARRLGAKEILL